MAENRVDLRVTVTAEGAEKLTEIENNMGKLGETSEDANAAVSASGNQVDSMLGKLSKVSTDLSNTVENSGNKVTDLMNKVGSQSADISSKVGSSGDQFSAMLNRWNSSLVSTGGATNKIGDATNAYNTSLIKAIPQLQVINPLMSSLGLSSLVTTGAIGLLGLGFLKMGQSIISTQGSITDLGITMGQYTQGPVKDYAASNDDIINLSNKMNATVHQTASAYGTLIEATHDQATAEKLLVDANQAAIATHKTLAETSKIVAQAYSQGATIAGKQVPAGMGAAEGTTKVMEGQTSAFNRTLSNVGRFFGRLFDPSGPDFILKDMGVKVKQMTPEEVAKYKTSMKLTSPVLTKAETVPVTVTQAPLVINIDGHQAASVILEHANDALRIRNGY